MIILQHGQNTLEGGQQSMIPFITKNLTGPEGWNFNILTSNFTNLKFVLIVLTEFNNFHLR